VIVKPEKLSAASGVHFAACYFRLSERFLVKVSEPFIILCLDSVVGVEKPVSNILGLVRGGGRQGGNIHRGTFEVSANENNLFQNNEALFQYYLGHCSLSEVYLTYTMFLQLTRGSPVIQRLAVKYNALRIL
jgi:hypothetical protein